MFVKRKSIFALPPTEKQSRAEQAQKQNQGDADCA
jgi:hypothetical protein